MAEPLALLVAAAAAFFVSASAGLGGSLLLVPALSVALGAKDGVALASLLLAANNLVKVALYRRSIPLRASAALAACTAAGVLVGARLLVSAPEQVVAGGVALSLGLALVVELVVGGPGSLLALRALVPECVRRRIAPLLALASGATSGFSGTSGPLKGVAVRSLGLDRSHTVAAAAGVSLVGDATKTAVFADAGLLGADALQWLLVLVPVMISASLAGRWWNAQTSERAFAALFWLVMAGYAGRLLGV